MKASELRSRLESGILGTYKASGVDNVLSYVEATYKKDFEKMDKLESEIASKKKLIIELQNDLTVAQEELFEEKAKSSQVDQRAIFIIEKEREIDLTVKYVERQCDERIAEIGKKCHEHLQLANKTANELIAEAQAEALQIIENAKQVANTEIDKANEMIEKIKNDFDASNEQLVKKQADLVSGVEALLSQLQSFDFGSNINSDIAYPEIEDVDFKVELPDVVKMEAENAPAPIPTKIGKSKKTPVKPNYTTEEEN